MPHHVLIAGAGIGGLAAALACARAGNRVTVLERTAAFGEVGAGIQIGPNVTRVLHALGQQAALAAVAAFPPQLQVRHAGTGGELGRLRLGNTALQRYGAPYATVHRADLHALLLWAVQQQPGTELHLDATLNGFLETPEQVAVRLHGRADLQADLLVGADGLWSTVRQQLLDDGPPRVTGHLAYRALVRQTDLPAALRCQHITAWLGPDLHVVQYPVRGGDWLNVVAVVQGALPASEAVGAAMNDGTGGANAWDHGSDAAGLHGALEGCCAPLRDLVAAITPWRLWVLCDRPPMQGPQQHGRGRVALLGDAAHPMRPYLAQGAGMAIEDADALGRLLAGGAADVPAAVHQYGLLRWQRNARVQGRAIRNGQIFHAHGVVQRGRDVAMALLGERLLDLPWLYGYRA